MNKTGLLESVEELTGAVDASGYYSKYQKQLALPSLELSKRPEGLADKQIAYMHGYRNIGVPYCGQAATASLLDVWGYELFGLPRSEFDDQDGRYHWDNDTAVRSIARSYPNRVLPGTTWEIGMFPGDVATALNSLSGGGVTTKVCYSGVAAAGWDQIWDYLVKVVNFGRPVAVLLDCGALNWSSWLAGHWVVVYGYDGSRLCVTNSLDGNAWIDQARFQDAWWCKAYPLGFNHALIDFWKN